MRAKKKRKKNDTKPETRRSRHATCCTRLGCTSYSWRRVQHGNYDRSRHEIHFRWTFNYEVTICRWHRADHHRWRNRYYTAWIVSRQKERRETYYIGCWYIRGTTFRSEIEKQTQKLYIAWKVYIIWYSIS